MIIRSTKRDDAVDRTLIVAFLVVTFSKPSSLSARLHQHGEHWARLSRHPASPDFQSQYVS